MVLDWLVRNHALAEAAAKERPNKSIQFIILQRKNKNVSYDMLHIHPLLLMLYGNFKLRNMLKITFSKKSFVMIYDSKL